jgi:hypothetical protein
LQQECEDGIPSQSPAIWRQHSRSSSVSALSGCKHAINGDANMVSVNSKTANLPTDFTRYSVAFCHLQCKIQLSLPKANHIVMRQTLESSKIVSPGFENAKASGANQ